jgi:hypothetical protein
MGQVGTDSAFGRYLTTVADNLRYHTFVDVGTWDGQGTTQRLVTGSKGRTDIRILSYETNLRFYRKAVEFYTPLPPGLELYHGSLHKNSLMLPQEIESHPLFSKVRDHYYLHYSQDQVDYRESPCVVDSLPSSVDVIVLDGGEFSTTEDWEVLKTRNPWIAALDDTAVIKCQAIREELLNDPRYIVIHDHSEDRNGWAVFERRA